MHRLFALIAIAALSLPTLAGCGAAPGIAPITRTSVKQAVKPSAKQVTPKQTVTPPSQHASTRPYLTQLGAEAPTFASNGAELAFAVPGRGVYVSRPDGSNARLISEGDSPAWSPDGGSLVLVRPGALVRVPAVGGNAQVLLPSQETLKDPHFTPDGRSVVFVSEAAGHATLYRLDLTGGAPVPLARGSSLAAPAVSPLDHTVVFEQIDANGAHSLARVALAGGEAQPLHLVGSNPRQPSFSPSGRSIAYVAEDGLYVANADGSQAKRIATDDGLAAPAWNPKLPQLVVSAPHGAGSDLQAIELPAK